MLNTQTSPASRLALSYTAGNEIHVLAINETRLDFTVSNREVHIDGYEIVRRDRATNGRFGGGVCFYIRNCINFSVRNDLSLDQLENLCILINKPKARPFLIATWYRPPNSPVAKFNYLEKLLGALDTENIEYYLLGDLNCDLSVTDLDHSSRVLMDITGLYNLSQLINEPTRVTDFSSTLIDHIFTNTTDKVVCSGVSHISISDHSLIYAYRKLSVSLPSRGHSTLTRLNFVMIFVHKIGVILIILTILMICGMLGKLPSTLLLKNMPHFVQSV